MCGRCKILPEPAIVLPGSPEFSPDVAGWRRERLPELPADEAIRVAPDWICEVLSPVTRGYDLIKKRPFYARNGVSWLWYVDVEARSISVSQLRHSGGAEEGAAWVEVAVHGDDSSWSTLPGGVGRSFARIAAAGITTTLSCSWPNGHGPFSASTPSTRKGCGPRRSTRPIGSSSPKSSRAMPTPTKHSRPPVMVGGSSRPEDLLEARFTLLA
jgi:hypothetical protein